MCWVQVVPHLGYVQMNKSAERSISVREVPIELKILITTRGGLTDHCLVHRKFLRCQNFRRGTRQAEGTHCDRCMQATFLLVRSCFFSTM